MRLFRHFYFFFISFCFCLPGRSQDKPNVLFIALDDLNDWVGCLDNYPNVKTPNIDQLAAEGVLFTNAHCAAPGCNPSRTSIFTGLRPSSTGVYGLTDDWRVMPYTKDVVTLPDAFQAAGYLTKGGGKLYHAHTINEWGLSGYMDAEPWDEFFPSKTQQMPIEATPDKWPINSSEDFYKGRYDWGPIEIEDAGMADAKVVSWAEKELSQSHDKPLFLAVGIYRPHWPWWVPPGYFDQHSLNHIEPVQVPDGELDDIPEAGRKMIRLDLDAWFRENGQREKAIQGYLAAMTFADAMVGRLLTALENGPMSDSTLIVLWSDHGWHMGSMRHWEKFALWDQTTHVPLIFVDRRDNRTTPSWQSGSLCNQPVSLIDMYPTLVELCVLENPGHLQGQSLVPLLEDPSQKTGRAILTTHKYKNHAIRSENWRYIRYADSSEELYDHTTDPEEHTNLAQMEQYTAVKDYLARWLPVKDVKVENETVQD